MDLSIDCPNCRLKVPIADIQRMRNGVHVNYVLSSIVEAAIQFKTVNTVMRYTKNLNVDFFIAI